MVAIAACRPSEFVLIVPIKKKKRGEKAQVQDLKKETSAGAAEVGLIIFKQR